MHRKTCFGEWLAGPAKGRSLRLIIEEMSEQSTAPSAAEMKLVTDPAVTPALAVSSGCPSWPWRGDANDPSPSLTCSCSQPVEFQSLQVTQTSDQEWILRYRLEVSDDGRSWRVATPSRRIDSYHRQPCHLQNEVRALESSLLPAGCGTTWARTFFEEYMLKTIEPIGRQSPYPDWLSGEYFLAAAVRPFGFGGVYNSGDAGNFDALIAGILCPEMAIEGQKLFPDLIHRFGFMPSVMNPGFKDDRAFGLDISGTTWGPCCYWDLFAWSRDREFLRWFSDACAKWARWWVENRDRNGDGWIEPGPNGCKPSSPEFRQQGRRSNPALAKLCPEFWDYQGLQHDEFSAFWHMICEIPWDDCPIYVRGRNRGIQFDPQTCSVNIHYIESQLYISLLAGFVAHAYRLLGRDRDAVFYAQHAERLRRLVADHCWDEATGFYYDRDVGSGKLRTFVKHTGAFVAMMMGLPTLEQARRMVAHLTNPAEFWTSYPVPVISQDSPDYSPHGYWSGRAWPPTNFFVLRGLLNYGFFDVADELLRRWMAHTATCVSRPVQYIPALECPGQPPHDARHMHLADTNWIVPENWNPETGQVHGSGGLAWGGLWLPAVILRHFWPVGEQHALLRPGGHFRFRWGDHWDVAIDEDHACVNGRSFRLLERATYLLDETAGALHPLAPGKADPVLIG